MYEMKRITRFNTNQFPIVIAFLYFIFLSYWLLMFLWNESWKCIVSLPCHGVKSYNHDNNSFNCICNNMYQHPNSEYILFRFHVMASSPIIMTNISFNCNNMYVYQHPNSEYRSIKKCTFCNWCSWIIKGPSFTIYILFKNGQE